MVLYGPIVRTSMLLLRHLVGGRGPHHRRISFVNRLKHGTEIGNENIK